MLSLQLSIELNVGNFRTTVTVIQIWKIEVVFGVLEGFGKVSGGKLTLISWNRCHVYLVRWFVVPIH